MSERAFRTYEEALREQHTRNEARRIRTRVNEARQNPHAAGIRWPFELLQNALDAGPRDGRSSVTVRVRHSSAIVAFEHDGMPFDSQDLAALLSGGSSKEFESEVTTGRFGTGFLVTHVLAERTRLRGLLTVEFGLEQFELVLDRGGDEDTILANIRSCNESIREATPIADADDTPSAVFEYPVTHEGSLLLGLEALTQALPYLYATRPNLGCVELLEEDGSCERWVPKDLVHEDFEGGYVEHRDLVVEREGHVLPTLRIARFGVGSDGSASALLLLEATDAGWQVCVPDADAPRIYREYPLRGSGFLPFSFILDGKFGPDQERSRLLMNDEDKGLLKVAFSAAVLAAQYAVSNGWKEAHRLAWASEPVTGFDSTDVEERLWWTGQLAEFASRLATSDIVEGDAGYYPAINPNGAFADFVIPRLSSNSQHDVISVDRMWPLVAAVENLLPPRRELAAAWTEIANGWVTLGLELGRITVARLGEYAGGDAEHLDDLAVKINPLAWLSEFLDLVGEAWTQGEAIDLSILKGLLPDQNRSFRSPGDIRLDDGISDRLKEICREIGLDIHSELFLRELEELSETENLPFLAKALLHAIPSSLDEDAIIERAVKSLEAKLAVDKEAGEATAGTDAASVRLLSYLWESRGHEAAGIARRIPLVNAAGRIVRWSADRMMMAPVSAWHESAQAFADAYPPTRVLANLYAGEPEDSTPVVLALAKWGIAFTDPITTDSPAELKERRLASMSSSDTEGVVVTNERFSQIALLQPEVLGRCQERFEEARALLGLVLCHVAPHDPEWRIERVVKGRKSRDDVDVRVRGALWLADLRFRAWVPVPGEEGRPAKAVASAATLKHLLDPSWLVNNDAAIQLLSEWFEFDELELRLLGIAPDDEERQMVRNGLARLVELGGADPTIYSALAEEIESRQHRDRDVEHCRRLGLAVQEAVRIALETHGLQLKLVDRGFDYEVTPGASEVVLDGTTRLEVGPYLLEVKATTTGAAQLTPLQARTAANEFARYVLCVVDLRGVQREELAEEWTAVRVNRLARIVTEIGGQAQETHRLVQTARTNLVGIRNDSALRYEVPSAVWESGISIEAWVTAISQREESGEPGTGA